MSRYFYLPILSIFLLGGCAKESFMGKLLVHDAFYEKSLSQTKSGQVLSSLETKAKISATYLSALEPAKYGHDEQFFVGLYVAEECEIGAKLPLLGNLYEIKLAGIKPSSIEALDRKTSELLHIMPLVDNWSNYYLVKFPKSSSKELNLTLTSPTNLGVSLTFLKPVE